MPGPVNNNAAAAAERARRIAEQRRQEAERAQRQAREAQQARARAQEQTNKANQRLQQTQNKAGDHVNRAERKQLERAENSASRAQNRLEDRHEAERAAKTHAIEKGDEAIRAQQLANDRAETAGEEKPFEAAEKVRNTYDAGSLNAKEQRQLFGTKAVVTPQEAAREDSRTVAEATRRSPAAGARELERQLSANADPAYRAELFNSSRAQLDQITRASQDPSVPQEELNATVRSLANSADLVDSPDAREAISRSLADASLDSEINGSGPERLETALGANAKDPAGARLALDVTDRLNETGDYDAADRIESLDPKLKVRAEQTTGETTARDSVSVKTAGQQREETEQRQQEIDTDARRSVDRSFDIAANPDKLPPNTKIVSKSDDRVVLEERNKDGEVVARSTAVRDGEQVRYEQIEYGKKDAVRTRIESGPDGAYVQTAAWKEGASKKPGQPPSVEELRNSRSADTSLSEERLYRNEDQNLVQETYQQGPKGIEQTTRTFSTQNGDAGIDDNFDDKFDYDQPIDKVSTKTVSIPAAGTEGPNGEVVTPSVTTSTSYAQDGVQATSTNPRPLPDAKAINEDASYVRPVYGDVAKVEEAADDLEDDKIPPKQWNLEVSNGNTYRAQTFVEGHEDLSTITTRTARGSTVTEKIEGTAPNADGEPTDVSSNSTRTFRNDGSLQSMHSESKGPDGVTTVQEFESDRKRTAKGLRNDDRLVVTQTDADGNFSTAAKRTSSLITADGPQLLSSRTTLTAPDGTRAEKTFNEKGESFSVAGPGEELRAVPESEIEQLQANQKELLAVADATVLQDVKDYASAGKKAVDALAKSTTAAKLTIDQLQKDADASFRARYGHVTAGNATRLLQGTSSVVGGVAAVAGVATSAQGLFNGIRDGNVGAILTNGAGLATSGKGLVDSGKGLVSAIRGGPIAVGATGTPGASLLSRLGGKFGVIGIGAGVVSSGLQIKEGIETGRESLIVQGGVSAVGAVAAPVAGIAVGGVVAGSAAVGATFGSAAPVVGTIVGAAVGAVVGVAFWGANKVIGAIFDDEHAIAEVKI